MPRGPRRDIPGAIYHVIARGNERRAIFRDDSDRRVFLTRLGQTALRASLDLHAFILMENHVHLLVQRPETPLAKFMQWLLTGYAIFFNHRYDRVGHLFQGRYKSICCERDAYLMELVRYIHLNPVRSGLVSDPANYPWSSHRYYVKSGRFPGLVVSPVLSLFAPDQKEARRCYMRFVGEGYGNLGSKTVVPRAVSAKGRPARSGVTARTTGGAEPLYPGQREADPLVQLECLAEAVRFERGLSSAALRSVSNGCEAATARMIFADLAVNELGLPAQAVAHHLSQHASTVSRSLQRARRLARDPAYLSGRNAVLERLRADRQ